MRAQGGATLGFPPPQELGFAELSLRRELTSRPSPAPNWNLGRPGVPGPRCSRTPGIRGEPPPMALSR